MSTWWSGTGPERRTPPETEPQTAASYWRNEAEQARAQADRAIASAIRSQRTYGRLSREIGIRLAFLFALGVALGASVGAAVALWILEAP